MPSLRERIVDFIFRKASAPKGSHKNLTALAGLFFAGIVFSVIILSLMSDSFFGFHPWPEQPVSLFLAALFLIAGAGLWLWSVITFLKTRSTPVPLSPPQQLVTDGPYAYARNPMLSGVFLMLFGTGFLLQSPSLIAIFTPLFILASYLEFKMIEEAELEKRLGAQYLKYRENVPIFIPRLLLRERAGRMMKWKWITFWKPSLGRRLTISFTAFGLIIGYVTVLFVMVFLSRNFVRDAGEFFTKRFYTAVPMKEPDGILRILDKNEESLAAIASFVKSFSSGTHNIFDHTIYYRMAGDAAWNRIFIDDRHVFRARRVMDVRTIDSLDKSLGKKVLSTSTVFLGKQDEIKMWIDVTRSEDKNRYVLSLSVQRQGMTDLLHTNVTQVLLFGLLLLIASHLLAHFFGLRLARPIEALSREAVTMASGDFDRRFHTQSRDEIGALAASLNSMAEQVRSALREREELLMGILIALIRTVDAKSKWTAGHSERVARHVEAMGRLLDLDDAQQRSLTISAILHDIGKIGVPEYILDKPGRLTDEEFSVVKSHPRAGADIIADIPSYDAILPGVLYHHERWDGSGYPEGLKGDRIPLFARIIAVADVHDAITDNRPYRTAWSPEEAKSFLAEQKGRMFDPDIVEAFLRLLDSGLDCSQGTIGSFYSSHIDKM